MSETEVCTGDQDKEESVTVGVKFMEKVDSCLLADPFVVSLWVEKKSWVMWNQGGWLKVV